MKKTRSTFLLLVAVLLTPMGASATLIQSTLEIVPGVASNWGGDATEVDYWYFTVNSDGIVTIDTLSYLWDRDGDGVSHYMDAFIYLFVDDGSLDVGDGIDGNDDALPGAGFGDGSTSSLDSYLSMFLSAGDYVLAIGDLYLSLENAVGGINYDSFYPAVYDGDYYSNSSLCGGGYNCDFADYQITFGGDVTVQNVPEPSTIALLSIGLLGMGLARRRKV